MMLFEVKERVEKSESESKARATSETISTRPSSAGERTDEASQRGSPQTNE